MLTSFHQNALNKTKNKSAHNIKTALFNLKKKIKDKARLKDAKDIIKGHSAGFKRWKLLKEIRGVSLLFEII